MAKLIEPERLTTLVHNYQLIYWSIESIKFLTINPLYKYQSLRDIWLHLSFYKFGRKYFYLLKKVPQGQYKNNIRQTRIKFSTNIKISLIVSNNNYIIIICLQLVSLCWQFVVLNTLAQSIKTNDKTRLKHSDLDTKKFFNYISSLIRSTK